MTDLSALIARVRDAKEASRELDARVYCFEHGHTFNESTLPVLSMWVKGVGWPVQVAAAPRYTTSLDAAVALCERVLPGWWWRVGTCSVSDDATIAPDYNSPVHGERLYREFPLTPHEDGCGGWLVDVDQRPPRSVALALCLAILTAKEKASGRD